MTTESENAWADIHKAEYARENWTFTRVVSLSSFKQLRRLLGATQTYRFGAMLTDLNFSASDEIGRMVGKITLRKAPSRVWYIQNLDDNRIQPSKILELQMYSKTPYNSVLLIAWLVVKSYLRPGRL